MGEQQLRLMNDRDVDQVLAWRNHPDIRRYMYSTHEITPEEHRSWYKNAKSNKAISLMIYEQDDKALGFVSVTRSRSPEVADWGFYTAPDAPAGTGRSLGELALDYAFTVLRLHKLCGQLLAFNERSVRFHQNLKFSEEARLREHHFDGNKFHDVICFGLLKREWVASIED